MSVAAPTIGLYIGFSRTANTGAWTLGTSDLGTGTILGEAFVDVYTDVGADLRSWNLNRGKSRQLDQYQTGTIRGVLDNRAADYSPLNLSGSYVTGGVTDVKPGRKCYLTATDPTTGLTHTLFRGRIRDWDIDYTGVFDSTATVTAQDAMVELANTRISLDAVGTDTGAQADEVLTAAGITQFVASAGQSLTQAMTYSGTALDALRTLEKTEQGALYVEANGDVYFSSRADLIANIQSRVSQVTFGAGDLDYSDINIGYESDLIYNSVSVTRTGGTVQTYTNTDSVAAYGTRAMNLTNMANVSDADALTLATYLAGKFGEPYVRVKSITIKPMRSAALMTEALTRQIRDRVTVNFSPVGGESISQEVFITGIKHEFTPDRGMTTTYTFDPTDWAYGWLLGTDALGSITLGF